jgi:hypothetical protein
LQEEDREKRVALFATRTVKQWSHPAMKGLFMGGIREISFTQRERIKRALMVCCAVVLFVMGIFLLFEPLKTRRAESGRLMDNVGGTVAVESLHQYA